jgi:hypothetical protein
MSDRHGIKTCVCYESEDGSPTAYPVHIEYEDDATSSRGACWVCVYLLMPGLDAINLGGVTDWPDWLREQVFQAIDADIEERREDDQRQAMSCKEKNA